MELAPVAIRFDFGANNTSICQNGADELLQVRWLDRL